MDKENGGLIFPIKRVGLLPNVRKTEVGGIVGELIEWFTSKGITCSLLDEDAKSLSLEPEDIDLDTFPSLIDLAVVLGGDGTMLRAAEILGEKDVPVLGINIGKLGFLTAVELHEMYKGIEDVLKGNYRMTERTRLYCIIDPEGNRQEYLALNEFVVGKLARERLVHIKTYVNDDYFMRFSGDGIILSTATGSTAYSMSAGGPIVTPELDCFILTAICPHMLFTRPIVLSPKDRVRALVEEGSGPLEISVDGRENILIEPGTSIDFSICENTIHVIQQSDSSFYRTLRNKFLFPQI